jgi:hypothetical protein
MRTFTKIPWLPLILLWITYVLVGWNLAAHHVIWFVVLLVITFSMTGSWAGSKLLEQSLKYIPQVLLVVLAISILATLSLTSSLFVTLGLTPFLTTFFAWNEMRFSNFNQRSTVWTLIGMTLLGLGVGEFLDLKVISSARY